MEHVEFKLSADDRQNLIQFAKNLMCQSSGIIDKEVFDGVHKGSEATWPAYFMRVFRHDLDADSWCFSAAWDFLDKGAIAMGKRIAYLLENGRPDFEKYFEEERMDLGTDPYSTLMASYTPDWQKIERETLLLKTSNTIEEHD